MFGDSSIVALLVTASDVAGLCVDLVPITDVGLSLASDLSRFPSLDTGLGILECVKTSWVQLWVVDLKVGLDSGGDGGGNMLGRASLVAGTSDSLFIMIEPLVKFLFNFGTGVS